MKGSAILDKIQKVLKNMSPHIDIQGLFFGVWAEENDREVFKPYGRAIWVIDVFLAIEQNIEFFEMEFVSELQSKEMKRACIPRTWLTRRYLDKLCELGIDAFEESANVLFRLLHIQEMAIKKTIRHTSLGFGLIKGKLIFKHANAIGIESTYSGQLDIVSKGSYKTWKQNADHAERIVSIIEKNYGWAILRFAKCLIEEYDYQKVSKKLEYWRKRYLDESTINSNFSNRVSKKYALLSATCSIAKEALKLDFSVKRMLRFIVKSEQNTDTEYDIGIKAYELFLQYVEINCTYFDDCYKKMGWETVIKQSRQTYGILLFHSTPKIVNGVEYKKSIIIIATKFMDFCREYGFAKPTVILKNWKRKGLLQSEKDRLVS